MRGTGIGLGGPIEIDAFILNAETDTGEINLKSVSSVAIGGSGLKVASLGSAKLDAFGSIALSGAGPTVAAGVNGGNINLKALGGGSDISCTVNQVAAAAPSGQVVFEAGQDILLGTTASHFANTVFADDGIRLTAGRDVIIGGAADLIADAFFHNTGGGVEVTAGRNIRVGDGSSSLAGIRAAGTGAGDISLTTGFGGSLMLLCPGEEVVIGGDVLIDADRVIMVNNAGIKAAGTIVIRPRTEGRAIDLGSFTDNARAIELEAWELDRMFASHLVIGSTQTGLIKATLGVSMPNVGGVTLVSGTQIRISSSIQAHFLALDSGRDIVITAAAAFTIDTGVVVGRVDQNDGDGQGGRASVPAASTVAYDFSGRGDGDLLQGGAGDDTLDGGFGVDTLVGRDGGDTYKVTAGDVVTETGASGTDLVLSAGDWTLGVGVENLSLTGLTDTSGTGNTLANRITGNAAHNALNGGDGNDTLNGLSGGDTLQGGKDNDRLNGGAGQDLLNGGAKNDKLEGGADADRFRFDTAPHATKNNDQILDFVVADDTIELENAVFTSLAITGTLPNAQFVSGPAALDANDFVIHDPATGAIYYDADGSGAGAAVQFASVTAGLALTRFDVFVT